MLNNPIITGNKLPALTTPGTAADLLSGKQLINASGGILNGTMTNRGAVSQTLSAGSSYTIPAGYHNGSGKVTASSLSSQTSGTATAADIASGKTAWVNGSKLTGTASSSGTASLISITFVNNSSGALPVYANYFSGGTSSYTLFNIQKGTSTVTCYTGLLCIPNSVSIVSSNTSIAHTLITGTITLLEIKNIPNSSITLTMS